MKKMSISPIILGFVFFWGVFGPFLTPIFYAAALFVISDYFFPNGLLTKDFGREGLVLFQLIAFPYFIIRPIFITLTLGIKEGIKTAWGDFLRIAFMILIIALVFEIIYYFALK